jgi:Ca-activated chloride channel family protein
MQRKLVLTSALFAGLSAATYLTCASGAGATAEAAGPAPGALQIVDRGGKPGAFCPLKHTDVSAEVSGFLARVTVTQQFENPSADPVEAVYTFPLPSEAAVDRMTMKVGDRVVTGKIKRREEARAIYDAARDAGQVASLLDQERPNIFTQSVANIMPGEQVDIEISYVETLAYEDGSYKFVFPMVVGPRYVPGNPTGKKGGGWSPDTDKVPDASRITPNVAAPGTRAGHDISLKVTLDTGVPVMDLRSTLHDVDVQRTSDHTAVVALKDQAVIPNRDFILTYDVAGGKIEDAVLTHRDERGGFFTLILQPPDRVAAEDVAPRELVFVLDTSGSMEGFPIEKAKETMDLAFAALRPQDTFHLITFAGDTFVLFPEPVAASRENLAKAQAFLRSRSGGGGTEMMTAIRTALEPSDKQDHVRIVCFMTDGYVGNDMQILDEIQKHPNARVFSFGIGDSVNRFLLDKMAEEGRGEVEYVTLKDDGSAAARRFAERVQNPLLTDISVDWAGLQVSDVYPARIPDVFSSKPIVITGRYANAGKATIRVRGRQAGRDVEREIALDLPEREPDHDVIATLWARRKIDAVMSQDWAGAQTGAPRVDVREGVTKLGLDFGLMTQYTSFVAVEEMVVNEGGQQRHVEVPVEMPEGVSYEGVFGGEADKNQMAVGGAGRARPMMKTSRIGGYAAAPKPVAQPASTVATEEKDVDEVSVDAPPPPPHIAKLDPALVAVVERVKKHAAAGPDEGAFVADGKAELQVWLTDTSEATIEKLRKLGFEVVLAPKSAKMVVGRISVDKLEALAKLAEVRYVTPNRS